MSNWKLENGIHYFRLDVSTKAVAELELTPVKGRHYHLRVALTTPSGGRAGAWLLPCDTLRGAKSAGRAYATLFFEGDIVTDPRL